MAVTEEESSSSSSRSSSANTRSAANGARYLAKCILPSSVVLQVVYGHIRSPTSNDIIFAKETSIELVILGEDGIIQSVCEQTVFGTIKDIAVLPWNDKLHAENSPMRGKDMVLVTSDSGKLSFLTFCNAMHRFFAVTHIQLSDTGNSRHQVGRLLAVHASGTYIAVSAHEERLALLSVSSAKGSDLIDKRLIYPSEAEGEANEEETDEDEAIKGTQRSSILGTIWSMCFISKSAIRSCKEDCPVLAILTNRRGNSWNELLMLRWNVRENAICVLSQYLDDGALAHSIIEVPHSCGFALLCRKGDIHIMDYRDSQNPCCTHRVNLTTPVPEVEEQTYAEDPLRMHDGDDEGFIAASALLELQDHAMVFHENGDPMSVDTRSGNIKGIQRYVCSWSWEPRNENHQRLLYCVDTGEFFMIDITLDHAGLDVNLSDCIYVNVHTPCRAMLWIEGGFLAAIMDMGDGMVLKLKDGVLTFASAIQNISPILDMSAVDYHNENGKQDQMFACCGVAPEGSLRIIRSGISVERLLRTAAIYPGITGTWTLRMRLMDLHHSFLVLSFVEETRVLSVGLSFTDVTDYVGFLPDVCTLACGLVDDRLIVQIHQSAVRLCLPTSAAHPEGIPMSSPICTSWSPDNFSISLGSIAHGLIVVATSNPCFLIILGIRSISLHNYEVYELQNVVLQSELSCMSVLQHRNLQSVSTSPLDPPLFDCDVPLPVGLGSGKSIVIGTHKPSVEVLSFSPGQGVRLHAVGVISLLNTFGVAISGCIPQDVRFVMADRLYILCGLRNGMLLRFEWPVCSLESSNQLDVPVYLQLIATRRIGITPVFLVPLNDSLDADIIALSDRPWLVQTGRHSLSYISISFQPSTHVTPVCSSECPKGLLFVAENSLNLVEMVPSRRLNVQKFHLGGTPRKVLYHRESKSLLVMRTDVGGDFLSSSDICCVDPLSGSVLSSFKFEHGETGKCMELVKAGNERVLVVGTSQSAGPAVMPNGEAESTKGRLIVLFLEHWPSLRRSLSFNKNSGCDPDKMLSSSTGSSPDDSSDRTRLEDGDTFHLRLIYSTTWPGTVLALCPYLDRYFLASSANAFFVCCFLNGSPQKVRRLAAGRTRSVIVSLKTYFTKIAVGDAHDGVLLYSYHEDSKKLVHLYADPAKRLVADCLLMDEDTAVVSDRKGSIAVLTRSSRSEDNVSAECNLTLSCSYYMGETAASIRKTKVERLTECSALLTYGRAAKCCYIKFSWVSSKLHIDLLGCGCLHLNPLDPALSGVILVLALLNHLTSLLLPRQILICSATYKVSIWKPGSTGLKGSFSYKHPADDALKGCESGDTIFDLSHNGIIAGTMLGSIVIFIPLSRDDYELLKAVQAKLAVHPLTAPILGNNHAELRGRENRVGTPQILDGDMLAQFLELTSIQQETVLALPCASMETSSSFRSPHVPVTVSQVVPLLERIHYALN